VNRDVFLGCGLVQREWQNGKSGEKVHLCLSMFEAHSTIGCWFFHRVFPPPAGCVQTDTLARIHASANCNRRIRQDVRVALKTRAVESRSNRSWLPSTLRIWLHVRRGRWPACNVVAYFPERKAREILCTGASRRRRPPTAIGFFCSRALALFLRIWFCAQLRL
jgi:hypothetical protein